MAIQPVASSNDVAIYPERVMANMPACRSIDSPGRLCVQVDH